MDNDRVAETFIAQAQERIRNTFIDLLGIRLLEVSDAHAIAEMTFVPRLQQLTGVFHAGALIALADTTATFACLYWTQGVSHGSDDAFPFTIQLSTNCIRNTNTGTVRAEAVPIHRGRTTMVVDTRLHDAANRLLLVVTTTHLFVST
jgi:1,4-dihydroxy-2-naphthoyl-CoA hydrolase